MPYKRYYKKRLYKRKKGYRRKNKRKYKNKAVITRVFGSGISDMTYVKLVYVDRIEISDDTLASTFEYAFRGNSIYHPDAVAAGHQPLYFDQYVLLYDKYRVIGSSIKLDVINNSGVSAMFYAVEPNTDDSAIVNLTAFYEQARSNAPRLIPIAARISSRLSRYASTRKVCGLTKSQLMDDTFASRTNNNPNNTWYWNLFFQNVDNVSPITGWFVIKITYYVQFFDRLLASQS